MPALIQNTIKPFFIFSLLLLAILSFPSDAEENIGFGESTESLQNTVTVANSLDTIEILKIADNFRLPAHTAEVETVIDVYKNDELAQSREYRVYLKPGRRSIIVARSAEDLGKKILMLEEKFWIVFANSRRPVRITPMQKLLGNAASGDIAIMNWSEYYSTNIANENSDYHGKNALQLRLESKVKGTTYAHIDLWLKPQSYEPLGADLYLKSGKLAKQAEYKIDETEAGRRIVSTLFFDRIQNNQRTEVRIISLKETELADKYFNPMYLARNRWDVE